MAYQAPIDDIMHALKTAAGLDGLIERGILGVDEDTIRAVIEEAGKFGAEVLDPLSAVGDRAGSKLVDGKVVTPPGWKEAYQQYVASSKAEWTVAKNAYVKGRSGWFSDRSACYLASGRPAPAARSGEPPRSDR